MQRMGAVAAIVLTLALTSSAHAAELKRIAVVATNLFHAAERGNVVAQTQVGFMYETGRGLPQDYLLATYHVRRRSAFVEPGASSPAP